MRTGLQHRPRRPRLPGQPALVFVLMSLAFGCLGVEGASQPRPTSPPVAPVVADPVVAETVAVVGRTRMLLFRLRQPFAVDTVLDADAHGAERLSLAGPALAVAGSRWVSLRVKGLAPGPARVSCGGATVSVTVLDDRAPFTINRAQIVSPASSARVWGRVWVGVEVWEPDEAAVPSVRVECRGSDGRVVMLDVRGLTGPDAGPHRRGMVELDADRLPPGPAVLTPIVSDARGTGVDIDVVRPTEVLRIEAESDVAANGAERPRRFGMRRPTPRAEPAASGGVFITNDTRDPAVCLPVAVPADGWYQVMARVRGVFAGGAWPSVAVVIDGATDAATSGRVLDARWHRVAIGVPVRLTRGQRVVSPILGSDFFAGPKANRSLDLDVLEFARVGDQPPDAREPGAAAAMNPIGDDSGELAMAAGPPSLRSVPESPLRPDAPGASLRVWFGESLRAGRLDGTVVASGDLLVPVRAWSAPATSGTVELIVEIDGRVADRADGLAADLTVPRAALGDAGREHTLVAIARDARGQSVRTPPVRVVAGSAEPSVRIAYPAPGGELGVIDGVVAVVDGARPGWRVRVLVQGQATGFERDTAGMAGVPTVMPLLARGLPPGPVQVSVVLVDEAGRERAAPSVGASVPSDGRALHAAPYARAIRLLNRFAFGPEPRELAMLLAFGETAWIDARLRGAAGGLADAFERGALSSAMATFPDAARVADTPARALAHLVRSRQPARLRAVMWAQNHFSTWLRKVGPGLRWGEHVRFAALGPARFDELLWASATSPAMLRYLDQQRSVAGRINENYARELLELHTLGVDAGYTQADVTNLARLFTGWMTADEADAAGSGPLETVFRFDPLLNEGRPFELVGLRVRGSRPAGKFDRASQALELLAAHPTTARFIAEKLAQHYIDEAPDDALVDRLADVYLRTHGDLGQMLAWLAASPELHRAPERVTLPIEHAVRLARVNGHDQPGPLMEFLNATASNVFDRPTPDGYSEIAGESISSHTMLMRWRLGQRLTSPAGAGIPRAWMVEARGATTAAEDRLIDALAWRLLGAPLSDASHDAARDFLRADRGSALDRARHLAGLIGQLPEANLK